MGADNAVEQVAQKLGIPWPSAEEGLLRQAADAYETAARAIDEQREACTARVRSVTAANTGGGLEEFGQFWGRYDGSGPGGGALPASAQACRDIASALRQFADEVEKTKESIRHKVEIAGAALVGGAALAVLTFGASAAAAAATAEAIVLFAAEAGVALSATVGTILGTALVGAAFGAVESVAVDLLVVQPLSVALDEQQGFDLGQVGDYATLGAAGGFVAGGAGGTMSRLPAMSATSAASLPRLATTLDGLTTITTTTPGRLAFGAALGVGTTEVVTGGSATGADLISGALGGLAAPGARRRTSVVEPEPGPARLVRDDDDFAALLNYKGVPKAHLEDGVLVPANPEGTTTVAQHVIGDNSTPQIKGNSPYISFKPPGNDGKAFGSGRIEVDLVRLQADIAAGRVTGTRVLPPEQVQAEIQSALDAAIGRHVDVPQDMSPAQRAQFLEAEGLSGSEAREARRLIKALENTWRDEEWLVQGRNPAEYSVVPYVLSSP